RLIADGGRPGRAPRLLPFRLLAFFGLFGAFFGRLRTRLRRFLRDLLGPFLGLADLARPVLLAHRAGSPVPAGPPLVVARPPRLGLVLGARRGRGPERNQRDEHAPEPEHHPRARSRHALSRVAIARTCAAASARATSDWVPARRSLSCTTP